MAEPNGERPLPSYHKDLDEVEGWPGVRPFKPKFYDVWLSKVVPADISHEMALGISAVFLFALTRIGRWRR